MILYITILPASSPASSDNGSSPPSFFSCLQGPSIPCTTFFLTTVRGGKTPHNILHHNYLIRPSQCITFQRYGHPSPPLYPPITSLTSLISNGCFPSLVTRLCIPRLYIEGAYPIPSPHKVRVSGLVSSVRLSAASAVIKSSTMPSRTCT